MKMTHSDDPDAPKWKRPPMPKSQRGVAFPGPGGVRTKKPLPLADPVQVGERLYTCKEAAELTNTTERLWRTLVEEHRVRSVRVGKKYRRIPESAINQLLAEGTDEPLA